LLAEIVLQHSPKDSVTVQDSTAEMRYKVLPLRPSGTEELDETECAALVTRDAMIGTAVVVAPAASSRPA
jgi:nitrile hydratase subunit alpha